MTDLMSLKTENLRQCQNITHGFFTRTGGASTGLYAGLNCGLGSDDDPATVQDNRDRALAHLGPEITQLCGLHQIHSAKAVTLTTPWDKDQMPQADGVVTNLPGIALGILTADCIPVLFADAEAGVIGAAHAGWNGAVKGILPATLDAMLALGADKSNIRAAVGPAIAQPSYEMGPEIHERFCALDPQNDKYFIPSQGRAGHHMFDLKAFVRDQLVAQGIINIDIIAEDTYPQESLFYSYRRSTHRGEPDYGRQISAIALLPA